MKLILALVALSFFVPAPFDPARAIPQDSRLIARWQIEFNLNGEPTHSLRFDALGSGKRLLLLLDPASSLVSPAVPTRASWRAENSDQYEITGQIEFPPGSVGRESGTATFRGTLGPGGPVPLTGDVIFLTSSRDPADPGAVRRGSFAAKRIASPIVAILFPSSGERPRRGEAVGLQWQVDSSLPIVHQQIQLSLDHGLNFSAIATGLGGDVRRSTWELPRTIARTSKGALRIIVTDANGAIPLTRFA